MIYSTNTLSKPARQQFADQQHEGGHIKPLLCAFMSFSLATLVFRKDEDGYTSQTPLLLSQVFLDFSCQWSPSIISHSMISWVEAVSVHSAVHIIGYLATLAMSTNNVLTINYIIFRLTTCRLRESCLLFSHGLYEICFYLVYTVGVGGLSVSSTLSCH